jgi:hypothetical protein
MNAHKIINGTLFFVTFGVALGIWYFWDKYCLEIKCSYVLTEYTLRPLLWGSIAWAIIFGTLLFFPSTVFKKWLLHVGLIGFLFMVYCVLNTDPRASSFWLDIDRGRAAWISGVVIALVTALYLIVIYLYSWVKTKTTPTPWSRLLVLIPAALVVYYFATT